MRTFTPLRRYVLRAAATLLASSVLGSVSWAADKRPECKAQVAVRSFNLVPVDKGANVLLKTEFEVLGLKGCGEKPQSTGQLTYGLRVVGHDDKESIVPGLSTEWLGRNGNKFKFEATWSMRADRFKRIKEVIDPSVAYCGCTN
jgi:hypothetical protein